ncbi:hypothetical protein HK098_000716 [Nowakowskiella sp. JEL0407]|nr:hypothetical protein HK098_000716 [Nowakowskiella sp. JEL0407]
MSNGSIIDKCMEMWGTRCIASTVKLGIADFMSDAPKTAQEIAGSLKLNLDAVSRLLRALSTTNVINQIDSDHFQLTQVGLTLTRNHPLSTASFLSAATDPGYWSIFGSMEESIRTGRPSANRALGMDIWEYFAASPNEGKVFAQSMERVSLSVLYPILAAYRFEGKRIIDVGGYHGVFLKSILDLQLGGTDSVGILFDLETIISTAPPHPRVTFEAGDFFDRVPSGDMYLLKHIIHDWDDAACITILKNVAKSMEPYGKVCIVELLITHDSGLIPVIVDMNMMIAAGGRERTEDEYANLFTQSGLKLNRIIRTGTPMASGSVIDKCMDLWATRCMGSAVKLGIADALADGPKTAKTIAESLKLNEDAVFRLLRALSTTNVINRTDEDHFELTEVGMTLTTNHPMSAASFLNACTDPGYWSVFGAMEESIKTGGPSTHKALGMDIWEYYTKVPEEGKIFAKSMENFSLAMLYPLLASYRFEGKRIVDVGGSHGVFVKSILDKQLADTDSIGILFDLESVLSTAPPHPRVTLEAGDFFKQVPSGDLYLLKHIIHDWDDASSIKILSNVAKSMERNGKVCVVELLIADDSGTLPAFMDMNMMIAATGRERTEADYSSLFNKSGLKLNRIINTGAPVFIIEGVKDETFVHEE